MKKSILYCLSICCFSIPGYCQMLMQKFSVEDSIKISSKFGQNGFYSDYTNLKTKCTHTKIKTKYTTKCQNENDSIVYSILIDDDHLIKQEFIQVNCQKIILDSVCKLMLINNKYSIKHYEFDKGNFVDFADPFVVDFNNNRYFILKGSLTGCTGSFCRETYYLIVQIKDKVVYSYLIEQEAGPLDLFLFNDYNNDSALDFLAEAIYPFLRPDKYIPCTYHPISLNKGAIKVSLDETLTFCYSDNKDLKITEIH